MKRDTKLQLTENSQKVLERRYLAKDGEGKTIETPEQLFRRVAAFWRSSHAMSLPSRV